MSADSLDIRLLRFRSRRDEPADVLALALLEGQRFAEALEVVQLGLLDSEDDPRLLVLEGRAWFEQGDLPQAQAALLRAIKTSPREKEPYRWLAHVLMKRGEPSRAVQVLERALMVDPSDRALQQAHARAQRLARIASEALSVPEAPPAPVRPEPTAVLDAERAPAVAPPPRAVVRPEPPPAPALPPIPPPPRPAARSAEPRVASAAAQSKEPMVADVSRAAQSAEPLVAAKPAARSAEPIVPELRAAKSAQPLVPPPPPAAHVADAGRASKSAQPIVRSVAPVEPIDTEPDTVPPPAPVQASLLAAIETEIDRDLDDEDKAEDAPTRAFEMPEEIQSWLEAERTGHHAAVPGGELEPSRSRHAHHEDEDPDATVMRPSLEVLGDALDSESGRVLIPTPVVPATSPGDRVLADDDERDDREVELPETGSSAPTEPEPPEQVLEMLGQQGIFESPRSVQAETDWVPKREAPRSGARVGKNLAIGWVLALAAAGGGYWGFQQWLAHRRADAKALIAQAVQEARDGQYESLLAAERHIIQAREADPKSTHALEELLFVHATRAIEDATGDTGYLRATVTRVEQAKGAPALIAAGKALLAAFDRNAEQARSEAQRALQLGANDARVLYLVGRLYQRSGQPEAGALLADATRRDAGLSLAWLSQAELARQQGELADARSMLDKSLGGDKAQLRAELWTIVLDTDAEHAPELSKKLSGMQKRIERGATSDKLLAAIARAGVSLAQGDVEGARAAVKQAAELHVQDPELSSLLGERAASVGEHDLAYRAANAAMLAAPNVRRYRDALANVLLKRGDGRAVLAALEGIDDPGAWLVVTRARAALLTGSRDALETAKKALATFRNTDAGKDDPDVGALLLRVDLRLGANAESLMTAARSLVQKAPSSSMAQLALGEAAVSAGQGADAVAALEKARALSPDDADAHYLLGRAYRMSGKPAEAKASFERALALAPSHLAAREALGGLLLDQGEYANALGMFKTAERDRGGLGASFGAIEALIGEGDVDAADERMAKLDDAQKALPAAQVLAARLAIAKKKPNDAVKLLEPLVAEDADTRTADMLALYGDALYAGDHVDPAAGAYEAALELDPMSPEALIGRAACAVRAEKTPQAAELIEQAKIALGTRVRPPSVRAALLLTEAKADMLKSSFTHAKELLSQAIALPGVPAETYFWYGETLAKTKTPGAAESYTKYLELEPNGYYADRAKKALAPR